MGCLRSCARFIEKECGSSSCPVLFSVFINIKNFFFFFYFLTDDLALRKDNGAINILIKNRTGCVNFTLQTILNKPTLQIKT